MAEVTFLELSHNLLLGSLIPLLMDPEALICQGPLWSSAGIQMLLSSGAHGPGIPGHPGLHPHLGGTEDKQPP